MKKITAVFLCVLLTACGFQPLYRDTNTLSGGVSVLNDIWIDTIPNESGLMLRNNLVDRFYNNGIPEHPHYHLSIELVERYRNLALSKDATTTRAQLVISANYALKQTATGKTVESGTMRAEGSYNILSSQYTTVVTLEAARRQIIDELADKLTMRMAIVMR